ncbi:MAG: ATP-binding cassette domain-containing protein [Bacteroidetes bacterium]|nr:MAG: ATP-binding cassette domain-containing protein [Bacteroidota bacterium]
MPIAVRFENISKHYKLGSVNNQTLKNDILALFGKKKAVDPNDEESVWALKNISFDIAQGEVLGIVGKNGAGKSTLLKILSKITAPTEGSIKIKGRMASLLEVGTGFHAELTGRENIFLNGAILGMSKLEVKSKLDEIVEFAGISKYLDTPVKRYSSGMYVRLGFAVAAHLEPEVLIVDEVLAVGDYEFQKKAIGKMQDVATSGRTVLFVSHNMDSVSKLCTSAVILKNGQLTFQGNTQQAISMYLTEGFNDKIQANINKKMYVADITSCNEKLESTQVFDYSDSIFLHIKLVINEFVEGNVWFGFRIFNERGVAVFNARFALKDYINSNSKEIEILSKIPSHLLISSRYSVSEVAIYVPNLYNIDYQKEVTAFNLLDTGAEYEGYSTENGCVFVPCEWSIIGKK